MTGKGEYMMTEAANAGSTGAKGALNSPLFVTCCSTRLPWPS
jgi:hypothetical protein